MVKKIALFFAVLLAVGGCAFEGPEELGRLVKEDPEFRQMIAARDQVHSQIKLIKDDLLSKKRTIDAQVERLRNDYDVYAKEQNVKIEKMRASVEANRDFLRKEIEIAEARLAARDKEIKSYQKTLGDVKDMLRESKGINLSSQEKQKWEERVLMLSEKIRPLSEEIQELKLQIRLKKRKIGFLR
ncbi:MAG: hypothetical protein HYT89_00105 [Candidatus Omnitrophica bacterium]|nr:hypothetical protein [Candidatus Omnitrophota bacterium]